MISLICRQLVRRSTLTCALHGNFRRHGIWCRHRPRATRYGYDRGMRTLGIKHRMHPPASRSGVGVHRYNAPKSSVTRFWTSPRARHAYKCTYARARTGHVHPRVHMNSGHRFASLPRAECTTSWRRRRRRRRLLNVNTLPCVQSAALVVVGRMFTRLYRALVSRRRRTKIARCTRASEIVACFPWAKCSCIRCSTITDEIAPIDALRRWPFPAIDTGVGVASCSFQTSTHVNDTLIVLQICTMLACCRKPTNRG